MKPIMMGAGAFLLLLSAPAYGQTASVEPASPAEATALPILLSATELAETRGGQTVIVNNQTLTAITSGNVINGNYVAGDISFNDNAFANFAGIGNFTVNTGAQNNLQTAMILTVNVTN